MVYCAQKISFYVLELPLRLGTNRSPIRTKNTPYDHYGMQSNVRHTEDHDNKALNELKRLIRFE